jgi:hypothetical protein
MYDHCEYTLLWSIKPLPLHSHFSHQSFFNNFQYITLYPLLSQMFCFTILLMSVILFSFSSFPKFHRVVPLLQKCSMLRDCKLSFLFLCQYLSFGSIFHVWEKTCSLCLSEPGLHHLAWCPPIAFIYFQTICCHYSLWLNKAPLCICTTFSWYICQL